MSGKELQSLLQSSEFKQGLEEMSCYLVSIKQERPIVYLIARCLWKLGYKFDLEDQKNDLSLNGKRIEFKFSYDTCEKLLQDELAKSGDDFTELSKKIEAGTSSNWAVIPRIHMDVCIKKPDVFVWIICSRDLSNVTGDDLKRICWGRQQRKYNETHPYASDGELRSVDTLLAKLQAVRPFSLLRQDVQTNGDFPSTYHFRICDFTP